MQKWSVFNEKLQNLDRRCIPDHKRTHHDVHASFAHEKRKLFIKRDLLSDRFKLLEIGFLTATAAIALSSFFDLDN
jgi:hypothetical protein